MYLTKKQRLEKINSISNCFNDLLDDLHRKRNAHDRNFQLKLSSNKREISLENTNKYEGLSLEKIIHQQNFDKKYSRIMGTVSMSPSNRVYKCQKKNINLWDLKLIKNGTTNKDHSLKRLEDLKLRMVYNQELENSEEQKCVSNQNFKQSNSSDFFKSTANSENRTFYTSKSSFYNNNTNIMDSNKNENMSFNSFKSSGMSFFPKKLSTNDTRIRSLSPKEKIQKVNFDNFNDIGENPFRVNIYDKNSILINSSKKKYIKTNNSEYNISPKNIYSPNKDKLSYYPNKHYYDINHLYDKSIENIKINKIENFSPCERLKSPKNSGSYSLLNKNRVSTAFISTRQYTLKRIDNLLKNFSNQSKGGLVNKPDKN